MENANGSSSSQSLQQAYRVSYLIAGHIRGTLSEEEATELDEWINASRANMELFGDLTDEKNIQATLSRYEQTSTEAALAKVKERAGISRPRRLRRLLPAMVAASLLLLLLLGLRYFRPGVAPRNESPMVAQQDLPPGTPQATLTLENGEIIPLGIGKDQLLRSFIRVEEKGTQLVYDADISRPTAYHTLTIPRKGHYLLVLSDGTTVWLNAASSIRFPAQFPDGERKVYVTGETYFEVAKDARRPFRVVAGGVQVEALGTQFNVNAYPDEPAVVTTLVEGSVLVSAGAQENLLQPGQQALVGAGQFSVAPANLKVVSGWKNEEFVFVNTPLAVLLRQVQRWYDAEVVFTEPVEMHLNARISRSVPLSNLLRLLEATEHVHFEVKGQTIYVSKG